MGRNGGIFRHMQKKVHVKGGRWVIGFFSPTVFFACIGIYKLQKFNMAVLLYVNYFQVLRSQRIIPSAQHVVKPVFVLLSFAN